MDYLSLCLLVKDENEYLAEWIDYHLLAGVERFFIYDNNSQVSVRQTLAEYIARGLVYVFDIQGQGRQLPAYDHCLTTFGPYSRWIGFIDTDEFLVSKTTSDLREFLEDYESFGGLAVSTLVYGSNKHIDKPDGGVLANYLYHSNSTLPENRPVKSIIQPDRVLSPTSPHHFIYAQGWWCVNESGLRVDNQTSPPTSRLIQLNHYWSRSESEYFAKLRRGRGDGGAPYQAERFKYTNQYSTILDRSLFTNLVERNCLTQDEVERIFTDRNYAQAFDLPQRLHETTADRSAAPLPVEMGEVPPVNSKIDKILERDEVIKMAYQAKDHPQVETYLLEMVELYPEAVMFRIFLADLYIAMNDPQKCWAALAGAWKIAPRSFEVLDGMGRYYKRLKRFDQAEKVSRLALEQDPEGFSSLFSLAAVLIEEGKFDESFQLVNQAVDLFAYTLKLPKMLDLMKTLGVYYYQQGQWDRALVLFQKSLEVNPDDVDLLGNMAKISFDQRQYTAAQIYLARASRVNPQDEEIQTGLRMVERALAGQSPAPAQ